MDFLDKCFDMWLVMLENLITDARIGSIFWMFVLVIIALLLVKIWRGVSEWTTH